ncbi:MAG: alpha/beta hydrolase [Bacteroidetes bacterium]|nr:alpha/beta hydrolase [Bacteroidota bacterium]
MSHFSLHLTDIHWNCQRFGTGPKLLIAFHGFNRTSDDFHTFEKHLRDSYTIVAVDLIFHGKTLLADSFSTKGLFTMDNLEELIRAILKNENKEQFSVMGYSFGGRLAMNCILLFPEKVDSLILIASDALRWNPGYYFATKSLIGKTIFRLMTNNPDFVVSILGFLSAISLIHPKAFEFYKNQLSFQPVRQKIYDVWMAHRNMVPDISLMQKNINKFHIQVLLIFGAYDRIIPARTGKKLIRNLKENAREVIIDAGHRVIEKSQAISEEIWNHLK